MTPQQEQAQAYPPHDCLAWQRQHYCSRPEYKSTECGTCGRVTGFQWRNWRKRIRSLFTSLPERLTNNE
jgi:hypothetical protein